MRWFKRQLHRAEAQRQDEQQSTLRRLLVSVLRVRRAQESATHRPCGPEATAAQRWLGRRETEVDLTDRADADSQLTIQQLEAEIEQLSV